MQEKLNIALIQANLVWENPIQNRINFTEKIKAISEDIDLIFLPEMFTTGFTMSPENVSETMQGETVLWMKEMAKLKNAAIGGSVVIEDGGLYHNRFIFMFPDETYKTYDKCHTFTLAGEHKVYKPGNKKLIIVYKGWKICPLICYDLRFPVLARNKENYDLLVYVASWPKPRIEAWDALLKARAIENMSYCIGVNRVGMDANNHEYPGHTVAYNCLGERLSHVEPDKEVTEVVTLFKKHLTVMREKLSFLDDMDDFTIPLIKQTK